MANVVAFRWNVYSTFFLKKNLEATFYSGFSSLSVQWKLSLQPTLRHINTWIFYLKITCVLPDEEHHIFTRQVRVDIYKDGSRIGGDEQEYFVFDTGNLHTFHLQAEAEIQPQYQTPCFTIDVEIIVMEPSNPQVKVVAMTEFDQVQLSQDLSRILNDGRYSNMMLLPSGGLDPIHVHSYMIGARWNSFFQVHPCDEIAEIFVEMDISARLLSDILAYVYSGVLPMNSPHWRDEDYVAELFRVIDRYKLHNLYKVFVKSDSQQMRETRCDLFVGNRRFRLDDDNGRLLQDHSETWEQHDDPMYSFQFRFEISKSDEGPCFFYSLQSRSLYRCHARVNLVFEKHIVNRETLTVPQRSEMPIHVIDYDLEPSGLVTSERILLEGDNEIFDDFDTDERHIPRGSEIQHFIRCYLNLSNGKSVVHVRNAVEDSLQDDRERYRVLADHMQVLMDRGTEADLRIICPEQVPKFFPNPPEEVNCYHRLHKAIFAARVPAYWNVLQSVEQDADIPYFVDCPLRSEAFKSVLLYIYTGKVWSFPLPFINEVYNFAVSSEFYALRDMIDRMNVRRFNL